MSITLELCLIEYKEQLDGRFIGDPADEAISIKVGYSLEDVKTDLDKTSKDKMKNLSCFEDPCKFERKIGGDYGLKYITR